MIITEMRIKLLKETLPPSCFVCAGFSLNTLRQQDDNDDGGWLNGWMDRRMMSEIDS